MQPMKLSETADGLKSLDKRHDRALATVDKDNICKSYQHLAGPDSWAWWRITSDSLLGVSKLDFSCSPGDLRSRC
jgi:hypothetical protein